MPPKISIFLFSLLCITINMGGCIQSEKGDGVGKTIMQDVEDHEADIDSNNSLSKSYNFQSPDQTMVLSSALDEISSLAYHAEDHTLFTNDDESGIFYVLDADNGDIQKEIKFGKKGDYEAIERIDNQVWIAKNNGTLSIYDINTGETKKIKNQLTSKNDIEGMCYDPSTNKVLLACKGSALNVTKGSKKHKAIYSLDIIKEELDPDPYMNISDSTLVAYVESNFTQASKSSRKKLLKKVKDFAPSGIAIHPLSKEYYLTSARGSLVVIMSPELDLVDIEFLGAKTIPQPEGITFDNSGNLYISTEGQGFSGKIFRFDYIEN